MFLAAKFAANYLWTLPAKKNKIQAIGWKSSHARVLNVLGVLLMKGESHFKASLQSNMCFHHLLLAVKCLSFAL